MSTLPNSLLRTDAAADQKWLLVFDNTDDPHDLAPYWPDNLNVRGAVIITTQISNFWPITDYFKMQKIDSFNAEEGARCLFRYLQRDPIDHVEESVARKISESIGGSPLALATVGGYVGPKQSLKDFLDHYRSTRFSKSAVKPYNRTLATVFDVALNELDSDARNVLEILAFLNPDEIPEEMLHIKNPKPELAVLDQDNKAG